MPDERNDDPAYVRARKRVEDLKGFYGHLVTYLAVSVGLVLINLLTNPRSHWFIWPVVIWGAIILAHGAGVLLGGPFGQRWEERKTRELMDRERSRWGPRPPQPGAP